MESSVDAVKIFKDWLNSEECYPMLLESWGNKLLSKARRSNVPETVLPYLKEDSPQERKEIFVREFWAFLFQKYPETLSQKQHFQFESLILKGNIRKVLNTALQAYIQTKKAEARKEDWGYVYRRVRETLKEEKNIHYQHDKKGWPYYSLDSKGDLMNNIEVLHSEPYSVWESPLNIISEMEFSRFKRKYFLELSIFFWKQAVSKLGKSYFFPVREVVRFLAAHYQTIASTTLVSLEDLCHEDDEEGGESKVPSRRQFESNILESTLGPLAETLIESWPYERKVCFALKYENPDISFREMADLLGMKRHSNAQYHYETAISRLKDFCSEWPGTTLPDIERDLFLEFINKVAQLCKKSFHGHK